MRAVWILLAGCHADAPPTPPKPVAPPYDGKTYCGWSEGVSHAGFVDDSRVRGHLDHSLVKRPIKARSAAYAACFQATLAVDPKAAGLVHAKFVILPDGSVGQIEIDGFDRDLDRCMCNELLKLSYPRFGSARLGKIMVHYPFRFGSTEAVDH